MADFKSILADDISDVFLDGEEFAETHNLNGTACNCVVQDVMINDDLTTDTAAAAKYTNALYGSGCVINVRKGDLPYIPETGDTFRVDGKYGQVVVCKDDCGMLTITWAANES